MGGRIAGGGRIDMILSFAWTAEEFLSGGEDGDAAGLEGAAFGDVAAGVG